ncbi:MAG TPA: erythromycin esterase family protein [Candidatus Micrarchaeia archaeon]|nr:erythromycin esterase family protein [Candidatus Micrarchaeia archaeon]
MLGKSEHSLVSAIRESAHPLKGESTDFDPLLKAIGEARFVLIGEASHGTHEFYRLRAQITKRLIAEKEFNAVAVEADWPDAYRVNQYVRFKGDDEDAIDALSGFQRFPAWMWRNADVLDFVGWLRNFNEHRHSHRAGFYGLDLYSLHASMRAVLDFLDKVDPEAARRARNRYACFDNYGEDNQAYGYATSFGLNKSCEDEVVSQWMEMRRRAADLARRDGRVGRDAFFFAEQNARLVKNAEEYYRAMFHERVSSWNLRDTHMAETLDALMHHLGRKSKVVVWAHNSHLGDARATEMGQRGELNLGQLVREGYGKEAILIGFTTNAGTVTAASGWDSPAERKHVRPALPGSYEALFHDAGVSNFLLHLRENEKVTAALREPRLERAIGVIYLPQSERASHYFHAQLPDQFDVVLHYDETRAVEPLERTAAWEAGEVPETYPSML